MATSSNPIRRKTRAGRARGARIGGRAAIASGRGNCPEGRTTTGLVPATMKIGIAFLAVCIILAAGGYVYLRWQLAKINRLDLPGLSDKGAVMNVLMVGSDSRARVTGDLAESTGKDEVSGQRSDTIMVLHVDPRQKKAAIFSIPRDLYVPIAGGTLRQGQRRLLAARRPGADRHCRGGAQDPHQPLCRGRLRRLPGHRRGRRRRQRLCASTGTGRVQRPVHRDPGCIRLDGDQGLAFVRSRYYETLEGGKWQIDPTADLGRIQRQQDFIRRMLRKAVRRGSPTP